MPAVRHTRRCLMTLVMAKYSFLRGRAWCRRCCPMYSTRRQERQSFRNASWQLVCPMKLDIYTKNMIYFFVVVVKSVPYQDIPWASVQLWYLCRETRQRSQSAEDGVEKHRQTSRHGHHPLTERDNSQVTTARASKSQSPY